MLRNTHWVIVSVGCVTAMIGTYAAGCDSENDAFLNGEGTRGHCEEVDSGNPHCRQIHCGNGILDIDRGEHCDDGNSEGGDGCSARCAIEVCYSCVGAMPSACVRDLAGTMCAGGGVCDSAGACVECVLDKHCQSTNAYCETNECHTRKDKGASCATGNQCATGFCADGYCCDEACNKDCHSCNQPGSLGECQFVQKYGMDDLPPCTGNKSCNGAGSCKNNSGIACTDGKQCVSDVCALNNGVGKCW